MQVSINLDENLKNEVDKRAEQMHITRSAYISMAVSNMIKTENVQSHKDDIIDMVGEFIVRSFKGDKVSNEEMQYRLKQFEENQKDKV